MRISLTRVFIITLARAWMGWDGMGFVGFLDGGRINE